MNIRPTPPQGENDAVRRVIDETNELVARLDWDFRQHQSVRGRSCQVVVAPRPARQGGRVSLLFMVHPYECDRSSLQGLTVELIGEGAGGEHHIGALDAAGQARFPSIEWRSYKATIADLVEPPIPIRPLRVAFVWPDALAAGGERETWSVELGVMERQTDAPGPGLLSLSVEQRADHSVILRAVGRRWRGPQAPVTMSVSLEHTVADEADDALRLAAWVREGRSEPMILAPPPGAAEILVANPDEALTESQHRRLAMYLRAVSIEPAPVNDAP